MLTRSPRALTIFAKNDVLEFPCADYGISSISPACSNIYPYLKYKTS